MTIFRVQSPQGEKVAGELVNGEFRKVASRSRHFLMAPPAIAIDGEVFDQLKDGFCHTIRIKETDEREFWQVSFARFRKHCFSLDRGHGRQYALTLDWWTIKDADGVLKREGKEEPLPKPVLGGEEQRQELEDILKTWRPVVGNERDINLAQVVKKLKSEYGHKNKNKKSIDQLEKQIIKELKSREIIPRQ